FDGFGGSRRLQFSPTGTRFAYSSAIGIQLRDGISGEFIADLPCGSSHKLEFSGDGSRIASLSPDDTLTLWNSESGALIGTLTDVDPTSLAFSPDCTRLAAGDRVGNVNLWDLRGINACGPSSNATAVTELALSRDCSRLACGFEDGTVELWGTSPTKQRIAYHQAHAGMVQALEFGPDGGLFASASYDGTIKLW
ncbi:hypothetical protein M378DRAFT_54313, partial [Amanita muscaria Koide BX008]